MNKTIVKIPEALSAEVERQFLEYQGCLNIINYLLSNNNTNTEMIEKYQQDALNRFVVLETLKTQVTKQYAPFEYYDYQFDFDDQSIIFQEKANNI